MTLQIVGAGLGRTGTTSLKVALELLLDGPCHHMEEVFAKPDQIEVWEAAVAGELPDWTELFAGYRAVVDWPAAAFWAEISEAFPEALVLLSTRLSTDAWWESADITIVEAARRGRPDEPPDSVLARQMRMWRSLLDRRFCPDWDDAGAMKAAYERHNLAVRERVPAGRLIDWRPSDGWGPICELLGLAVPNTDFPHVNTEEEFRAMWID